MSSRDDEFRPRAAPPRARGKGTSPGFVSRVLKEVSKSGARATSRRPGRPASTFGRGRVAARVAGRGLGSNARRVVVKARFVVLKRAGAKSVSAHLRYIERDGVTREGGKGRAYGADVDEADDADLKAFEERGRGNRHQFRFIVSPEDGMEVEDLRGFARRLMERMAVDLETPLDWVAVDHWDTDNPHTHIVLNGHCADGERLVIAPDYLAHGMRLRACEIATEWLGPRTELEMQQILQREVGQHRFTGLDRELLKRASAHVVDMGSLGGDRARVNATRSRLETLRGLGLVERVSETRWRLSPEMTTTLAALGEREDAIGAVRAAFKGEAREIVVDGAPAAPIVGRIAGKGLADELKESGYLVVDALDGRAHYVRLPSGMDVGEFPVGGIVEVRPGAGLAETAVDRRISELAVEGVYREAGQRRVEPRRGEPEADLAGEGDGRRLEALRRAGIVERLAGGVWRVPPDFSERARRFDAARAGDVKVELRSHLSIERQCRALGATWLDRELLAGGPAMGVGFADRVRDAISRRLDFLVEIGLAERQGVRTVVVRDLLATLRQRELEAVGRAQQQETGLAYRSLREGMAIRGVCAQEVQLVSGRYAVVRDDGGFSLVPWQPALGQKHGRQIRGLVFGERISWEWSPGRGV